MASLRYLLLVVAGLLLVSCDDDDNDDMLPPDGSPSLVRILPADTSVVVLPNTPLQVNYIAADNEQLGVLNIWWVYPAGNDSLLLVNDTLSGTQQALTYSWNVPDTFPIGQVSTVLLRGWLWDNVGKASRNDLIVQINTAEPDTCTSPPQYNILTYNQGDTLYNRVGQVAQSSFNLLQRRYADSDASADLRETTSLVGSFNAEFSSPNTSPEARFVVLSPSEFNYNTASWCTLDQAFRTHVPRVTTGSLQAGDLVILKMDLTDLVTPNKAHYAVVRILEVVDNPGEVNDYIVFTYRRTENN